MADSRRLLLSLIDRLLDNVRSAAAETKSLGRLVAHICQIDAGDAESAAVYLKERRFSGHAERLTKDTKGLLQRADKVFRGPFVADPSSEDRKQELLSLRSLNSKAHRLVQFLNELKPLVEADSDAGTTDERNKSKRTDAKPNPRKRAGGRPEKWADLRNMIRKNDAKRGQKRLSDKDLCAAYKRRYNRRKDKPTEKTIRDVRRRMKASGVAKVTN